MNLARIRKAAVAAFGAGAAAFAGALSQAGRIDQHALGQALGVAVLAAATVGWATWKVPNQA